MSADTSWMTYEIATRMRPKISGTHLTTAVLTGVKEAGLRRFYRVATGHVLLDVLHPAGVVGSPAHHLQPIDRLQRKEENESQAEPGMQKAGRGSASEQRREEAEDPRQIDPETRQQSQEEKDPDHPVEKAGVHGMAQQFPGVNHRPSQAINRVGAMYEAIGRGRHLVLLSRGRRWRGKEHDLMAQQFPGVNHRPSQAINRVGAMYEAIGRGRHLVLLSRGRRWRVNAHDR